MSATLPRHPPARSRAGLLVLGMVLTACERGSGDAPAQEGDRASERPNVLLVVVDTLRADRMPFHGYPRETAPFLAELAEDAVVFDAAWSSSSWTAPSTASIFTSLYPYQHGVTMGLGIYRQLKEGETEELELNRIPADLETIPSFLSSLGYRTFAVTDNPNISGAVGFDRDFDRFANDDYAGAEWVNETLAGWKDELGGAEPWFVYLHYMDPHAPYHERAPWFRDPRGGTHRERKSAQYDSEIGYVDRHLAEAFELLGVDESTLVVFTADHGEELGDHGRTGHGFQLFSELIRVPLLVRPPGPAPAVRRVAGDVSTLDVLPTLRELLGAPTSPTDEGRSLVRAWSTADALAEPRVLFSMRTQRKPEGEQEKWAVVRDGWKLITTLPEETIELYDLRGDPDETKDVAARHPERVRTLLAERARFVASARRWEVDSTTLTLDPESARMLQELGYAGEDDPDEGGD